jgi:hypothetical protein
MRALLRGGGGSGTRTKNLVDGWSRFYNALRIPPRHARPSLVLVQLYWYVLHVHPATPTRRRGWRDHPATVSHLGLAYQAPRPHTDIHPYQRLHYSLFAPAQGTCIPMHAHVPIHVIRSHVSLASCVWRCVRTSKLCRTARSLLSRFPGDGSSAMGGHGNARKGPPAPSGTSVPTATLHAHAHMERTGATSLRHVYICFQNVQAQPACGRTTSRSRRALKTDH